MIPPAERRKMQAVSLCGPKVVERLEGVGITSLADLRGQRPIHLVERVNLSAGAPSGGTRAPSWPWIISFTPLKRKPRRRFRPANSVNTIIANGPAASR